ncbi:MAG: Rrf2 family transcriptional regulator [Bryobacterales bacterium]|nr:Rrf2 family transcriptional regulator [Bryobacterales bacterium]
MLKLTKKADYGLIAMRHLALAGAGNASSAKEIAEAYSIPLPLLAKILQRLAKTGLLESLPGSNGGYRLMRHPASITALEVIGALEGPVLLTSCYTVHGECGQSGRCTVREPLRKVHEGIIRLLGTITMSEMSESREGGDAGSSGSGAAVLSQVY